MAIDVSITHPVSPYYSTVPASALTTRENVKKRTYGQLCKHNKSRFEGFIFETYGRFSKNVEDFIKVCCREIAEIRGVDYPTLKHQWVTRLSATLQRTNSYFLYQGYRNLMITDPSADFDIANDAYEAVGYQ